MWLTVIRNYDNIWANPQSISAQGLRRIRQGGLVVYPAEGCYGIGCDPRNRAAVRALLHLKKRHPSQGLILVAAGEWQLRNWIAPAFRGNKLDPARATWPGPVTWLVPAAHGTPYWLRGRNTCIAVRVTDHPPLATLCRAARTALVSTSANGRGQVAARRPHQVYDQFGGILGGVLPGHLGALHQCTEIRDLVSGQVLRVAY
ncbi:MAG TPA: hypothetical protein ENI62_08625 [Gammaproteobacteria bacterium]|mgnify:CR=1 FL=1|nr:hypothetical protein [Gammaproteobacteria bacterium]